MYSLYTEHAWQIGFVLPVSINCEVHEVCWICSYGVLKFKLCCENFYC